MPVLRSIIVLSITQIIAWGAMFMFVSVTAAGMADDLLLRPSAIYLGPTVMLVAMAFCSPLLAPVYARHGARLVLLSVLQPRLRGCGCWPAPEVRFPILRPGAFLVWPEPQHSRLRLRCS